MSDIVTLTQPVNNLPAASATATWDDRRRWPHILAAKSPRYILQAKAEASIGRCKRVIGDTFDLAPTDLAGIAAVVLSRILEPRRPGYVRIA